MQGEFSMVTKTLEGGIITMGLDENKLAQLKAIVEEGTQYGEVLGVWTNGESRVEVLTENVDFKIAGYVLNKVIKIFNLEQANYEDKLGSKSIPVKYRDMFTSRKSEGGYYVEKEFAGESVCNIM